MRPKLIDEEELLDQLLAAFADLGFDGTSVRAICRHLGVSHNMIHQRYQSKDAAWTAAVDHAFTRLVDALFAPMDSDLSPRQTLRTVMYRWIDAVVAQPALARIIHQESARTGPRFDYMFDRYIGPIQSAAQAWFAEQQSLGNLRAGPLSTAYFFLSTWGVGGLASSADLAGRVDQDDDDIVGTARLAVEVLLDGLFA